MSSALQVINLPLSVPTTKKKRFYLNLNQYRNAHHFILAKAKVNFHEIVAPLIRHLPRYDTVSFIYTVYTGTEQLCDTNNICSVVDKFFSDVMVTCNKIEDDNRKIVLSSLFQYGGVDRIDPRVEVIIVPGKLFLGSMMEDQQQEEEPMQIRIVQAEIEEAISDYVKKKLTVNAGQKINIELLATRGPEGYQAVIDIVDDVEIDPSVGSTGIAEVPAEVKTERASAPAKSTTKAERPASVTKKAAPAADKVEEVTPPQEPEVAAAEEAAPAAAEAAVTEEAPVEPAPTKSLFEKVQETAAAPAEAAAETPAEPAALEQEAPKRPSLFGSATPPQNS